jgi:hypothetical protein
MSLEQNCPDPSTASYLPTLLQFLKDAASNGTPLMVGEYGMPIEVSKEGDATYMQVEAQLDQAASVLLDRYGLSASCRPEGTDPHTLTCTPGELAGGALTWNPLASTLDFRWQPGTFRSGEALSVAIMGE